MIKIYGLDMLNDYEELTPAQLAMQFQMLKHLNHPSFCRTDYIFDEEKRYYIVMPFIKGAMLGKFVHTRPVSVKETLARSFVM